MSNSDTDWADMLKLAKLQQQEYYELLPTWTKYVKSQYKYLRQNIGFAIFGPPSSNEKAITKINDKCTKNDITEQFCYIEKAEMVINSIYEKIIEVGDEKVDKGSIYFGIIFNITFRSKNESTNACNSGENDSKKDNTEETKNVKCDTKEDTNEKSSIEKDDDKLNKMNFNPTPIFKIKRLNFIKSNLINYEIWYIDTNARVYRSWKDYKEHNILPKCTMVLPMNGFYQPDLSFDITEDFSTVWLEILESPECATTNNVLNTIDTTASVASIVSLSLGIVSLFTPLAPITIGAAVTGGLSGTWAFGRSVYNLVDRNQHKQSISIMNRDAFCAWLTITGSAVGLAAHGGSYLFTETIKKGANISRFAKAAYNTLIISNLGINGCGVAFSAYCMYERYSEGREISTIDILSLGSHVLFFGNAVMNFQLAGDLIKSTQGKILDDYRSTLRTKRLRKAFNRAKRNAVQNNANQTAENAEVIRYINKKIDMQLNANPNSQFASFKNIASFDKGNIIIDGIKLLDPMTFVRILCEQNLRSDETGPLSSEGSSNDQRMLHKLQNLLIHLLADISSNSEYKTTSVPDISSFGKVLEDMKYIKDAPSIFTLIFQIAVHLLQNDFSIKYIDKAIHFVWSYVKESVEQACLSMSSVATDEKLQKKVKVIMMVLFQHMDDVVCELFTAFKSYMLNLFEQKFS